MLSSVSCPLVDHIHFLFPTKCLFCSYWPFDHTHQPFLPAICCVPIDHLTTPIYFHQVFFLLFLFLLYPPPISAKYLLTSVVFLMIIWPHQPLIPTKYLFCFCSPLTTPSTYSWPIDHTYHLFPLRMCLGSVDHLTTPTTYFHQVFVLLLLIIWPHSPLISSNYLLCSDWPFDHTYLLFPPCICSVPIDHLTLPTSYLQQILFCSYWPFDYIHLLFPPHIVLFLLTILPHPPLIPTKYLFCSYWLFDHTHRHFPPGV